MKGYFFNILMTALVCLLSAILVFLVGRNTASAITAGALFGVILPLAYCFGGMMDEDSNSFNGKRLIMMLISGVAAGVAGGFLIGIG